MPIYWQYINKPNMDSKLYEQIGALAKKWKTYPNEYNPNDPNNKQILIEKNMKLAVNVALKYRGMGVLEEDLIGAALLGLSVSYDKYNPNQSILKDRLLGLINDNTTGDDFIQILTENMPYGANVCEFFKGGVPETPSEMAKWVGKNIRPAKFTSVATMWVRAYVLAELDKHGKVVRGMDSNSTDYLDDEETTSLIGKLVANDEDTEEREEAWQKLFCGIPAHCTKIIEMRYGIGVNEPMTLKEIAEWFDKDVGYVKRVLADGLEKMRDNATKWKLDMGALL